MNSKRIVKSLSYLYRIVEAGERGYAVAAANVDNMGLKLLFKSYAQQRARFKSEILAETMIHHGNTNLRSSIRGVIHRGRIDIFAALSAGKNERERIVLREVSLGERAALNAYQRILKDDLPNETRSVIEKQYEEVKRINERIQTLRAVDGNCTVVQLFESPRDASRAWRAVENSVHQIKSIEYVHVSTSLEHYEGRSSTVLEASASGAVGGLFWGSLIGLVLATSAEAATYAIPFGTIKTPLIWALMILAGVLGGTLIGTAIGYAIGIGIKQEDAVLYELSRGKSEQVLLLTLVEFRHVSEIRRILDSAHLSATSSLLDETSA